MFLQDFGVIKWGDVFLHILRTGIECILGPVTVVLEVHDGQLREIHFKMLEQEGL